MEMNKLLLMESFNFVKDQGWIKSLRRGHTGIGYTFEQYCGVVENSLAFPDFYNIEIKTHRKYSNSMICLFSYDPKGNNSYEIKHIYDCYGYPSIKNQHKKVFYISLFCNQVKRICNGYTFSLEVDRLEKKLYLLVHDEYGRLVEKSSFWYFHTLEQKLYNKLEYLAFIVADRKFIDDWEYFKYESIEFYKLKGFDFFLDLLESGKILISFNVGPNKKLSHPWQVDNHGTSFCINAKDLVLLYETF